MIELALRAYLLTVTEVTDLCPDIFIDLSPQGVDLLPRLVLRLMPGGTRTYDAETSTGMVFADIECTIQAAKIADCHAIYTQLRGALDKFSGEWDDTTIEVSRLTPPYSRLNLPIHGDEQGIPSLVCTCEVTYRE